MRRLASAMAIAALLGTSATAGGATRSENVAACDPLVTTMGSGPANWRQLSQAAGPLGVFRDPLSQMSETGNGQLLTKMPVIVSGHQPVTMSVPLRLRDRVFLFYGLYFGKDGKRSTTFDDSPGFSSIEFQPCENKPRTAWPGGVRIKGRAPVHLTVSTGEGAKPILLRLGRPHPHG